MKVYFVRHGESILNKSGTHQFPDTPLNDVGLKQAKSVAHRFERIPIDLILTSSYTRALQTAQEIEKIKSVPLIQSDLFIERKLPSFFPGKLLVDPEIVPVHQKIRDNYYNPEWHYADEENFTDLVLRAQAAFEFIHAQKQENMVVVTHGYFLNVMIYHLLFQKNSDHHLFNFMKSSIEYSNTGLTLCEYKDTKWRLLTLNDYAHLGE